MNLLKNKKAQIGSSIFDIITYTILVLLVFSLNYASLSIHKEGFAVWQEYYSNEVVKSLELAKSRDQIIIDVQKGVEIAGKTSYNVNNMFTVNKDAKEFCTQFNYKVKTCYFYFSDVEIEKLEVNVNSDQALLIIDIK